MRKLYNIALFLIHIIGLIWNTVLSLSISIFYLERALWEELVLWSGFIVVFTCHYALITWGSKRNLLIMEFLDVLRVIDFVLIGMQLAYLGAVSIISFFNVPFEAVYPILLNCVFSFVLRIVCMRKIKS